MEEITRQRPNIRVEVQDVLRKYVSPPPEFKSIDELIDWKIEVWERQYEVDYRVQALWHCLSEDEIEDFYETIILSPYIPIVPFFNQILLLFTPGRTLYGGARGGGKTDASLIGAFQYVDFPKWKVAVFRLTYPDLANPGAIMDRALDWLHKDRNKLLADAGLCPHWSEKTKTFTFPSGAKVTFSQVQHEEDANKYQGLEFHLVIIDEAVHFTVKKINKLSAINRRGIDDPLPLKMWFTGNPGGVSHDYFKEKYVNGDGNFIDSKYIDNPYLDQESYERDVFEELEDSDPILYRQWKEGDWEAIPEGKIFKREWFTHVYSIIKEKIIKWLRFWDLAATEEEDPNKEGGPDWTVGGLLGLGDRGNVFLEDIQRFRKDPGDVVDEIIDTANLDIAFVRDNYPGAEYLIRVEQEGMASGKIAIDYLAKDLAGFDFDGEIVPRKSKLERAKAFISFIKHGGLKIKDGEDWYSTFVNEITVFPTKKVHDDQVDMISGSLKILKPIKADTREGIAALG